MDQREKRKFVVLACNTLLAILPEYTPEHKALLNISMAGYEGIVKEDILSSFIERWELADDSGNSEESKLIYRAFIAILRRAEL